MRRKVIFFLILCILLAALWSAGCISTDERTPLKILAAGSLLTPLEELEKEYELLHPDIDIIVEGHGSIQCIRQVTDLNKSFDLVMVADESLIPDMMYRPGPVGVNYSDSYTVLAGNRMVLAYTNQSACAGEITEENWPEILQREGVRIGFSNPALDAAGYRALLVMMLAGEYYGDENLFSKLAGDSLNLSLEKTSDGLSVRLPAVLKTGSDSNVVVRDASLFLLSLLESGGIDYAFDYQSVAVSQGLSYVALPDEINLGSKKFSDTYDDATVYLGFQRFSTIGSKRTGIPIVYAATIPYNAQHTTEAEEFLKYATNRFSEGEAGWPPSII